MYCKKCGNEISDGAKFCKFCGAVQETQAAGSFQKPQNVDPVKEAEQQRQRERLDQQIVSLESERKALEEKIKEDLLRLSQKVVLPATDLQQKKCPNCGGMVAGARFCPKCGYDLINDSFYRRKHITENSTENNPRHEVRKIYNCLHDFLKTASLYFI